MEQTAKSAINRKVRNNRVARTINETAKTLGCSVEIDHNQNLVLIGSQDATPKCLKLIEVMHNYTEVGHITFENGTTYCVLTIKRNKVAA